MIKTLKAMAISLPIAAGALLAAPGTANAAADPATPAALSCDVGEFCAWVNDGFTGFLEDWPGDSTNWGPMSDNAESLWNRHRTSENSRDNVQIYQHVNFGTETICVLPNEQYDTGMDDNEYSSHALVHTC